MREKAHDPAIKQRKKESHSKIAFNVLEVAIQIGTGVSLEDLAAKLKINSSTLSLYLNILKKNGLVDVKNDQVFITAEGESLHRKYSLGR